MKKLGLALQRPQKDLKKIKCEETREEWNKCCEAAIF